jgi:hypothetical protein
MNINLLQKLKQKLKQEPKLADIWGFYMDHFADHEEFTDMGEPLRDEVLDAALINCCKEMYSNPKSVAGSDRPQSLAQQQTNSESDFGLLYAGKADKIVVEFMSIYLAKQRFFHGPVEIDGRYGGMFYFEDIKTGMVAIPGEAPMVNYSRFSITEPDLN